MTIETFVFLTDHEEDYINFKNDAKKVYDNILDHLKKEGYI